MSEILAFSGIAVVYVALNLLSPDPRNPRRHSDRQIKQIARSIAAFGFVVPILVDGDNRIIAGVGRFLAARFLGLAEVPVIRLEHLTEVQAKALRIADSRLTEMSDWNDRLLAETLKELSEIELNFSIEATGFTMGEIDLRIEGLSAKSDGRLDPADQIPEPTGRSAISAFGDLWRLGRHWLLCGSALLEIYFQTLLRTERAHIIFTDPPYNVPIRGHASGKGRIRHREFTMAAGETRRGRVHVVSDTMLCTDGQVQHRRLHTLRVHGLATHRRTSGSRPARIHRTKKYLCVWVKDNGGMGSLYRSMHEFVLVFKSGADPHRIMCNSDGSDATGPTSGTTRALTPSAAGPKKAIWRPCIQP